MEIPAEEFAAGRRRASRQEGLGRPLCVSLPGLIRPTTRPLVQRFVMRRRSTITRWLLDSLAAFFVVLFCATIAFWIRGYSSDAEFDYRSCRKAGDGWK